MRRWELRPAGDRNAGVFAGNIARRVRRALLRLLAPGLCATALLLTTGCPGQGGSDNTDAVTPDITISVTHGTPPLTVSVSGANSTSRNEGDLQFLWDFGGEAQATTVRASHTFNNPGLYRVLLTVTDAKGETGTTGVDVQVQGSATPVAVIQASTNAGPVPLVVQFDGSGSYAADDVIHDYYWDFGDGSAIDRRIAPRHVFEQAGTFTVLLNVTTAGGVAGSTTTTIAAGARNGSLQFDGSQFATLTVAGATALDTLTFEAWFKAGATGGPIVSIGSGALLLEVLPADNTIRFQYAGQSHEASAANLSGSWRHVALTYDGTGSATVYLDGVALTSAPGQGAIAASQLRLGPGYVGKIAEVRLWSAVRSAEEIAGNYQKRITGTPPGLIGYWRLDFGAGQVLENQVGSEGYLGASGAEEPDDPAWSADGPSLN
jgi:PKD repeat protein